MVFPDPADIRFGLRTLTVAVAVVLVGWALVAIVSDGSARGDRRFCLYQNQYYSQGAIADTGGILRECAAAPDGSNDAMQWVDPR